MKEVDVRDIIKRNIALKTSDWEEANAASKARRFPMVVMKGDGGEFWVVRPDDGERLFQAGYEYANGNKKENIMGMKRLSRLIEVSDQEIRQAMDAVRFPEPDAGGGMDKKKALKILQDAGWSEAKIAWLKKAATTAELQHVTLRPTEEGEVPESVNRLGRLIELASAEEYAALAYKFMKGRGNAFDDKAWQAAVDVKGVGIPMHLWSEVKRLVQAMFLQKK